MKYTEELKYIVLKELRAAVYCRVSTKKEVQESSLIYQNEGLIREIKERTSWEFCGSFTDVATGTSMKKQTELNKLVKKCLDNELDIIVVKSVSRFSRNLLDALKTIDKLVANGNAIFFDTEKLFVDKNFEHRFLLTIHIAMAQEEVIQMSRAIAWGFSRKYEKGEQPRKTKCLGYDYNDNGKLIINIVEAEIIKHIFNEYLNGNTAYGIANLLNDNNVLTARGGTVWRRSSILFILKNELYTGILLMPKTMKKEFDDLT